jgi:hypothetical protein
MSEIHKALSKAQSKMRGAVKDSTNPHFRSRYADLESVIDALKAPFAECGLSYYQSVSEDGLRLITTIAHESGETISGSVPLIIGKQDMQGVGSAITYARRYGLAALAGVSQTDDDGNAACEPPKPSPVPRVAARQAEQFKQTIAFESRQDKAQHEREVIQAAEARMREEPQAERNLIQSCLAAVGTQPYEYPKHKDLAVAAAKELGISSPRLSAHREQLNEFLYTNAYSNHASVKSAMETFFSQLPGGAK